MRIDHSFMHNYHKRQDEKRMVVILSRGLYGVGWMPSLTTAWRSYSSTWPTG